LRPPLTYPADKRQASRKTRDSAVSPYNPQFQRHQIQKLRATFNILIQWLNSGIPQLSQFPQSSDTTPWTFDDAEHQAGIAGFALHTDLGTSQSNRDSRAQAKFHTVSINLLIRREGKIISRFIINKC
jgi:hypothetical protein